MREDTEGDFGVFIIGAFVGATLAVLFASVAGAEKRRKVGEWLHEHHASGHDIVVKLKHMLRVRHNGIAVNGHVSPARRHKRA